MRTWLFTPAHDERKARKALDSNADVVILDWEDSVPGALKEQARIQTRELASEEWTRPVVVRINSEESLYFHDDLLAIKDLPLLGVMIPKVASRRAIIAVSDTGQHPIPLIESAQALEALPHLLGASERLDWLAFGTLDYLADIGATATASGEELIYARGRLVACARSAGLLGAIDGISPRLDDPEGLARDCTRARHFGFKGKLLIHPKQIEPSAAAFAPSPQEVAWAQKLLTAFREAQQNGISVFRLEGRLVDAPVLKSAEQILAAANAGARRD